MNETAFVSIAEGIDRTITLPIFNWDNMSAHIPMVKLYDALLSRYGKSPLMYTAEKLRQHVKKGDIVVISTGFYVSSADVLETDGPVGAATLARGISIALGAAPVMLVEEPYVDSMSSICNAAGLRPFPVDKVKGGPHRTSVVGFPKDDGKAEAAAQELMRNLAPSALISVECPDHNSKGFYHTAKGLNVSAYQAKFPFLYDLAYKASVFTAGIGDFGNEIGMAALTDEFKKLIPSHSTCMCGCGGGIVGTTKTHASIIANISNWGAYGLEAALALLVEDPDVMHDESMDTRVLEEAARVGYFDPVIGFVEPSADGASARITADIVHLLHSMVRLQESHAFIRAFS